MRARRAIPMTVLGMVATGVVVGLTGPPAYAAPQGTVEVNDGRLEVTNPEPGIFQLSVVDGFDVDGQHHPETAVRVGWFGGNQGGFLESAPTCFQDEPETVFCELGTLVGYDLRTSNFLSLGDYIQVDVPLDGTIDAGAGGDKILVTGTGRDEVHGGPGVDELDFGGRTVGVVVSLDDQPNDGRSTGSNQSGGFTDEHDNIHSDVEWVSGTEAGDIITGSSLANSFKGRGGNDTFYLSSGGADVVAGGPGRDEVRFRAYVSGVDVTLDGVANDGAIAQGSNIAADVEDVQGTPYDDELIGTDAVNLLDGYTGGTDILRGFGGDDQLEGELSSATLDGGDGDDTLHAGTVGHSTITGGPGTDWVSYAGAPAKVKVVLDGIRNDGPGTDLVQTVENILGTGFGDTLTGNAGPNVIKGGYPDNPQHGPDTDTLSGAGGNDTFASADINGGKDVFIGGAGIDTIDFSGTPSSVTVTLDNVANDFPSQANVKADIEHVVGGFGNDTLVGSAARNELEGGPGNDEISGGGASDILDGGPGADLISGGAGVDQVTYAHRSEPLTITLENTDDDGAAGEGDNVQTDVENVVGGSGADVITGSDAANTLDGGDGNDVVVGGPGKDAIRLGAGDDTFHANTFKDGADDVVGGPGTDLASYGGRTNPLTIAVNSSAGDGEALEGDFVHTDIEQVVGGAGPDKLTAAATGTALVGGGGNDTLVGGAGQDWFNPGLGSDDVKGMGGTDTVTYQGRTEDLFVALDELAQDGFNGEKDNIHGDIEVLLSGSGDDFLIGAFSDTEIHGGAGNDHIDGAGGFDTAYGGIGQDECIAEQRFECES